ncbi:ankyrin [Penicillium pulvis]|uniref:ankyrin n=1 Tax=Penicillium pulvis TaxID=1562058 RepID=UPI0025498D45|nr:ankyrin [Penicillium pulvis]KAJ5797462.1 ankyrin [Penicillium pulvis]
MAYHPFHQPHSDFEGQDVEPIFNDTDGSPVYDDPYGALMGYIASRNDVAALKLYQDHPKTKIFWEGYDNPSWHPLLVAEESGSFDALRLMLEIYLADPSYIEPLDQYLKRIDFSPINVACAAAQKELMLWLLDHALPQATIHDRFKCEETPLFSAARGLKRDDDDSSICDDANPPRSMNKHEEFICFLLDQGCSVRDSNIYVKQSEEDQNSSNQTAELEGTVLGAAIPNAGYKMVSRLIAEGAEVHACQIWLDPTKTVGEWFDPTNVLRKRKGVTALHIASLNWNLEGIHALIDHRGDLSVAEMVSKTDENGRIPLHWALLGYYNDRNTNTDENTQTEIPSRMMTTIKLLLEAKPDTINARSQQGESVFNFAVQCHAGPATIIAIVDMLLDFKPLASTFEYPDILSRTALQDAVDNHADRYGRNRDVNLHDGQLMQLIEKLLAKGVPARLSLHRLCDGGWNEEPIGIHMIDRLLEGASINDTDGDGCTAMHYLVRDLDQIDAIRYLISLEADVNVINHKGNTPLHEVMKSTMIRRMGEDGLPDPSQPLDSPYTTREELIKMLVDAGGSMNQPNKVGHTPAHLLDELNERRRRKADADRQRAQRGRGRGRGCESQR